jgi:ribosome-binding factor A
LTAEVHPDDGADPRTFFRKTDGRGKPRHADRRLCRQVLEALDAAMTGELGDLTIVAVDPAPDSGHLLVTVASRQGGGDLDSVSVLESLERASRRLRAEVASAITRKRVPALSYRVVAIRTGLDSD